MIDLKEYPNGDVIHCSTKNVIQVAQIFAVAYFGCIPHAFVKK